VLPSQPLTVSGLPALSALRDATTGPIAGSSLRTASGGSMQRMLSYDKVRQSLLLGLSPSLVHS